MATIVCLHAHPDDESISTGGTMVKAIADGHRVVLVTATRGECGEVAEGFLAPGETLGERRSAETLASAEALGLHRVEFLGYRDSGMIGEHTNTDPSCFWQADVEDAATKLAALLLEENADVLTVYDDHGGYGHPDHIQVHRVGIRAAEIAGIDRVFEATMNRDAIRESILAARESGEFDETDMPDEGERDTFGKAEADITHAVDVAAFTFQKRSSMRCHASQINDDSFFMKMPEEMFSRAFGTEWFIEHGSSRAVDAPMATALL